MFSLKTGVVLFFIIFYLALSAFADSAPNHLAVCPQAPTSIEGKHLKKWCNHEGQLVRVESLFGPDHGDKVSQIFDLKNGLVVNRKTFDLKQVQTSDIDTEYHSDGTYTETRYSTEPLRKFIKGKARFKSSPGKYFPDTLESWGFAVNKQNHTSQLVSYTEFIPGTNIPLSKGFYKNGESQFWQQYTYNKTNETSAAKVRITQVRELDADKNLSLEYSTNGPVTFFELYKNSTKPAFKPLGIVVIDSGFETDHPDLINYWYQNPVEQFDGSDNDGNGLVDDVYGLYVDQQGNSSTNIREIGYVEPAGYHYYSHGTHVASLAVKDLSGLSMAAFAGATSSARLIENADKFVRAHKPPLVNMSFGYGRPQAGLAAPQETFDAVQNFIGRNPETLFFLAVPNSDVDIDIYPDYPASYNFKNTITVSSIDASDWQRIPSPTYARRQLDVAYGETSVDIYAPGRDILGAYFGKTHRRIPGTSMATPKALNIMAKGLEMYPNITTQNLKKLFLLSAYIPNLDEPLPCVSGGVVYPERFFASLKNLNEGMRAIDAVLKARLEGPNIIGEGKDKAYLRQLKWFWQGKGLTK